MNSLSLAPAHGLTVQRFTWTFRHVFVVTLWLLACSGVAPVRAADAIRIVFGNEAPPLEKLAASELTGQLQRLFPEAEVSQSSEVADAVRDRSANQVVPATSHTQTLLVGNPTTNPAIARLAADTWPKLTEQEILVESIVDHHVVLVGGRTPESTWWATQALVHQLGLRHRLLDDVLPHRLPTFPWPPLSIRQQPRIADRAWHLLGKSPSGWQAWPASELTTVIRQLSKLRYNRLVLDVAPWHPWVEYTAAGQENTVAVLWAGQVFPIDGDTVGKKAFLTGDVLANPDFPFRAGGTQVSQDAVRPIAEPPSHLVAMRAAGRQYFQRIVTTARTYGMTVAVEISPVDFDRSFQTILPSSQPIDHGMAIRAALTAERRSQVFDAQAEAYVAAYPGLDQIAWPITSPQNDRAFRIAAFTSRAERFKDLTSALTWLNTPTTSTVPNGQADQRLTLELGEPAAGLLPQSTLTSAAQFALSASEKNWQHIGFDLALTSDIDVLVRCMAHMAWRAEATPEESFRDFWDTVTGNTAATDRLWRGQQQLELATRTIAEHQPEFAELSDSMLLQHYRNDPSPAWWQEVADAYGEYTVELYRAHGAIEGAGKSILFGAAKRGEFASEYMASVQALRQAAVEHHGGNLDAALESMELAMESIYNGITALADVAETPGDRAVIAVLNAYAYRPVVARYELLSGE